MSPLTEVIDMRAPATAPIPLVRPEPSWDSIVRPSRPTRRRVRARGAGLAWMIEKACKVSGALGLLLITMPDLFRVPVI